MKNEPVLTVASITALVSALIALLAAFGLNLSNEQVQAILSLVAIAAPIVVGVVARGKVEPVQKRNRRRQ